MSGAWFLTFNVCSVAPAQNSEDYYARWFNKPKVFLFLISHMITLRSALFCEGFLFSGLKCNTALQLSFVSLLTVSCAVVTSRAFLKV